MKGYVFDLSRLRKSPKQSEHLGGDPLADVRRRARRDLVLRAMLREAAAELALAALAIKPQTGQEGEP